MFIFYIFSQCIGMAHDCRIIPATLKGQYRHDCGIIICDCKCVSRQYSDLQAAWKDIRALSRYPSDVVAWLLLPDFLRLLWKKTVTKGNHWIIYFLFQLYIWPNYFVVLQMKLLENSDKQPYPTASCMYSLFNFADKYIILWACYINMQCLTCLMYQNSYDSDTNNSKKRLWWIMTRKCLILSLDLALTFCLKWLKT